MNVKPYIPGKVLTNAISKAGRIEAWEQRLLMGVTAYMTQPFIDMRNKSVDEKTRKYSVVKTLIKISVGTSMGCLTRYAAAKLTKKHIWRFSKELADNEMFQTGVKNTMAALATLITVFTIDLPVTKYSLSYALKKLKLDAPSKNENGGKKA